MKLLITGKNGQVGWELQRTLATLGTVCAVDVEDVDLTDAQATRELVHAARPDLIVHPAAYTAVDNAEANVELAMSVNAVAPGLLAAEARSIGAGIISYSTDYVFDGTATTPYTEDVEPSPLNVYGRSKLAGEAAIATSGAPFIIFRTSWVYGARGANFLRTMLGLGSQRDVVSVVSDQIGAPTTARSLAEATAQAVAVLKSRSQDGRVADPMLAVTGIYHASCGGETSWYGFAREIFSSFEHRLGRNVKINPISTAEYPTFAIRPSYSLLSTEKLRSTFGVTMPHWREAFALVAEDMLQGSFCRHLQRA